MNLDQKDKEELMTAWIESADDDWRIAQKLYDGSDYHYALFFCQLVLEKLLKALCVKNTNDYPPAIHDLTVLIEKTGLLVTQQQREQLAEITTFNIEARYDIFKKKLYEKATSAFTKKYIDTTAEFIAFFKQSL